MTVEEPHSVRQHQEFEFAKLMELNEIKTAEGIHFKRQLLDC